MNSKIKITVFMLTAIFMTVGCDSSLFPRVENGDKDNDDCFDITNCGKFYINETESFLWCVVPHKVTKDSENRLIIKNHTKRVVRWSSPFSLEYFDEDEWIPIELKNAFWCEVPYSLLPGETRGDCTFFTNDLLYSLVKEYNNSKKGKYRISRNYSVYHIEIFSFKVYVEFIVK